MTPMPSYGKAVADRQSGTDALGIKPPRIVVFEHGSPRN
jgi:hypothetical protein